VIADFLLGAFIGVALFTSYRAGIEHERRRSRSIELPKVKRRG